MQYVETRVFKNRTVHVVPDDDPLSPRDWDNLGTILYTSSRYVLGDEVASHEEIEAITKREDVVWLPVYAYIHSGVMLSTKSFADRFDSGMSGIIYCELSKAQGLDAEQIKKNLEVEVSIYSKFVSGEVYGYILEDEDGIEMSSCYGYFGIENAIEAAVSENGLEPLDPAEANIVKARAKEKEPDLPNDRIYIGTLFRDNRDPLDLYSSDSGFFWFDGETYTQTTGRKVKTLQAKYRSGFEYRIPPTPSQPEEAPYWG